MHSAFREPAVVPLTLILSVEKPQDEKAKEEKEKGHRLEGNVPTSRSTVMHSAVKMVMDGLCACPSLAGCVLGNKSALRWGKLFSSGLSSL